MNGSEGRFHFNSVEPPKRAIAPEVPPGTCLCPSCRARDRGKSRISLAKPGQPERGWRLS